MKKNAYIAAALAVVMLAGALYFVFSPRSLALAEEEKEHGFGQRNAFGLKGKFAEEFNDLEKGFSKIFDRVSNISPSEVPQSISVNPQGDVRLTSAEITAISGPQITVKLWGWNFTVDRSNARIVGRINLPSIASESTSTATSSADLNVGDRLLVKGTVNSSTGIVTAIWVKNISLQQRDLTDIQGRINQLLKLIQELQAQIRAKTGGGD